MYRFTATGRHKVIRRSKKPFNSARSFNPPLSSSTAVSRRASRLLPDPSGEAQPMDSSSSAGKGSGGSAEAAAQDLGLGPPALPGSGLWQHPLLVAMPQLPAGGWHEGEPPGS